jgi:hypothetical protein
MMAAGSKVEWIDVGGGFKAACDPDDPSFEPSKWPHEGYYLLAILPLVPPKSATTDVMGYAPVTSGPYPRAYVFYNRIQRFSDLMTGMSSQSGVGVVLGHVIAHEAGHLLIGNVHDKTGIMRADWDYQQWKEAAAGRLLFSRSQAEQIRKHTQNE